MGKALTKSQLAASIAEKTRVTRRQAEGALETLVELAYKNAKNSFVVPGLGKLVLVQRSARIGRNPRTGEPISIPAKKVLKFRIAKAMRDAIVGAKEPLPATCSEGGAPGPQSAPAADEGNPDTDAR